MGKTTTEPEALELEATINLGKRLKKGKRVPPAPSRGPRAG